MDKLGDGEMNSDPLGACEVNAEESTDDPADAQQIHPPCSLLDPSSEPDNDEYLGSFERVEKSLGFFTKDDKYFGSFESDSHLSLRDGETDLGNVTLRQWLTRPQRIVSKYQCLHIFGQVVEAMSVAHSQGLVLRNIRPSCLRLSSCNRISLIGSVNNNAGNNIYNASIQGHLQSDQNRSAQKPSPDFEQNRRYQQAPNQNAYYDVNNDCHASSVAMASSSHAFLMRRSLEAGNMQAHHKEESNPENCGPRQPRQTSHMELSWYTSPEELMGVSSSFSSDVYSLGVLFFELFCSFSSEEEQCRIMSDLRHRVPPPHFLREWPKEITFCLWLLHPEPNQRPKLSEVLQSEIMNEVREVLSEWKEAGKLENEIADGELLLDFLFQVQHWKQETAEKLCQSVTSLTSDIEIVLNQQSILKHKGATSFGFSKEEKLILNKGKKPSCPPLQLEKNDGANIISTSSKLNVISDKTGKTGKKLGKSNSRSEAKEDFIHRRGRMLKNFKELEKFYFTTRCMASDSLGNYSNSTLEQRPVIRTGRPNLDNLAGIAHPNGGSKTERLGSFFDSLCKYLQFSKFKVKATLRQGDLLNSSSLVCSLSFDRDKELFATAGVSKKIKVFECDAVVNEIRDIYYPVTEMTSRSKLRSICWNSYIKNQIASSSFDGMVQLWDITRNLAVMDFKEHRRRVWSVDFSQTDPRQLASGGDDGYVKLWNITQEGSIGTIRTNANVCCVQFPPNSPYLLALGSADYKIYCYDLRNIKKPWCLLASHKRAVSYVKFLDSSNIVSASTDSTLKLWDLAVSTGEVLSNPVRTFTAHKNEKNFVGLSVADGYIATGSESNEVFVYHRSIPIPVARYKFNYVDTMNGPKIDDDTGQFVSSVCWRGQSQTLVAANSKGNIKILEMV